MNSIFKLHSPFEPAGDQPQAISELLEGLEKGIKDQVLLGVTGSGKTYTMAKIIEQYKKPTIQSEVGIEWEYGQRAAELDPNGISIRQALWAGMMGGTAGAAMQWWWDSWIHPGNLWTVFNGAGIYAEKMDLTAKFQLLVDI